MLQLWLGLLISNRLLLVVVCLVPFVLECTVDNGAPVEVANATKEIGCDSL